MREERGKDVVGKERRKGVRNSFGESGSAGDVWKIAGSFQVTGGDCALLTSNGITDTPGWSEIQ